MSFKIIGVIFVMLSCGGCGFYIASQHMRRINQLEKFINVMHYMECELEYHHSSLPSLCKQCADRSSGNISKVFSVLSDEMEKQLIPNVYRCMQVVLDQVGVSDAIIRDYLLELGKNLGGFDLAGQVLSLQKMQERCEQNLIALKEHKSNCIRSYQTLGLCAGAAIAILLV